MAFLQPYGTGFGYSGYPGAYPSYTFAPTAFAAAPEQASHAEGSQAGEEHASQQVSVSGFAADPNAAFFGQQFYGFPGQQTVLPGTLVPLGAPRVRRPGYNERLVAWRNRQKAFNRYKKATKEAIKNANKQVVFPGYGAHYGQTVFGAQYGAPFGATYLPGAGFVYDQQAGGAEYSNFGAPEFSQGGASQAEAHDEPEIRGTQV